MKELLTIKIEIVFEDKYLLAFEKPAGLHTVLLAKSALADSLAKRILKINPSAKNISSNPGDAGLVNRLDFETSGIVLAAKTPDIWQKFRAMFKHNKISKYYCALQEGRLPALTEFRNFIGTSGRRSQKVKVFERKPAAKYRALNAESEFRLIKYLKDSDVSITDIKLITGRRHQIRAHAAHISKPLLGDKLYGSARNLSEIFSLGKDRGFFLHAWKYCFAHPVSGKELIIESKSKDFLRVLAL
jgi:23S rRNA-/tRNA-specific pseudouridylate synthase